MRESSKNHHHNQDLAVLAMILATALVIFELWMATTDHDNTRDQHMGTAVTFARGHIDLLHPMLLGFNANGVPTPLDFPVWQALTAILMKCFGIWYGWGNIVALLFFFSSLAALFDLCRRVGSARVGWWAVIFSLVQPLSYMVGGQAGGDSTTWTIAMWFIYFCYRMLQDGGWGWWLAASLAGGLCAITKTPFFMAAGLTTFFWLLLRHRRSLRAWFYLSSAGVVGTLGVIVWNYYCHLIYNQSEFQTMDMDPMHPAIHEWYFGTMAYRLNLHNWVRGLWHLAGVVFGNLSFILGPLLCLRLKQSAEAWLFLLAAFCTTLVFTPLLWFHYHYFFVYAPAAAWLCAIPAAEFEFSIWDRLRASAVTRVSILLAFFILSLTGTYMAIHFNIHFDNYQQKTGELIKAHTAPTDKLLVWGMVWGDPFLRAERQGLTGGIGLNHFDWFNHPAAVHRLQELGFTKIVLINPSPFVVALTSVIGQHGDTIEDLHQDLPAIARQWPVIFETPQLLIVQIPELAGAAPK